MDDPRGGGYPFSRSEEENGSSAKRPGLEKEACFCSVKRMIQMLEAQKGTQKCSLYPEFSCAG
jgi:hypothetical protein